MICIENEKARNGEFVELEEMLALANIPFDRQSDGYYEIKSIFTENISTELKLEKIKLLIEPNITPLGDFNCIINHEYLKEKEEVQINKAI